LDWVFSVLFLKDSSALLRVEFPKLALETSLEPKELPAKEFLLEHQGWFMRI